MLGFCKLFGLRLEGRRAPVEVLDKDGFEAGALGAAAFLHVAQDHGATDAVLPAGMLQSWIGLQALNNPPAVVLALGGALVAARDKLRASPAHYLRWRAPAEQCKLCGPSRLSLLERIAELEGENRPPASDDQVRPDSGPMIQ